jgi:hypothetical protein
MKGREELFLMQEDLSSLKIRINDLNKLLQTQAVLNDNESKKD